MERNVDTAIRVVVLDHELADACLSERPASLLAVPLGQGCLLDHIASAFDGLPGRVGTDILILPTFEIANDYAELLKSVARYPVRTFGRGDYSTLCAHCDTDDYLLIVDASRWPLDEVDLADVVQRRDAYEAAMHLVGVGSSEERATERVEQDGAGSVKRVQRLFSAVSAHEVASAGLFASLVPARVLAEASAEGLPELRSRLASVGLLSRDLPLDVDVVDLRRSSGLLTLNERVLARAFAVGSARGGASERAAVHIGRRCAVAPTARLIGPVIIQDRVRIDANATVVGPCVVGAGAHIQQNAIVAQSVLARRAVVASGATLRHCVTSGSCPASRAGLSQLQEPSCRGARSFDGFRSASARGAYSLSAPTKRRSVHLVAKRAIDIAVSMVGLIVLSPVLLIVALLVKLTSPGPVFFIHRREQRGGKEFPCIKFRTMVADAHIRQRELYQQNEVDGPQFKLRRDPRVTRLGAWLRKTNIDEIPQLFNVLWGHMSLVGPRPSPFRENQICVPWRRARLSVRPGITGLWQICRSADRTAGDFHEWIFYDIAYVRHFSIWLDIKILLATVLTGGWLSVPMSRLVRDDPEKTGDSPKTMAA